jgi:DNA-binding HxlR family transcriptional regulator
VTYPPTAPAAPVTSSLLASVRANPSRSRIWAAASPLSSRQLLDRISDKWVALVLAALGSYGPRRPRADRVGEPRPMRYSELSRRLAGVSQKMLTQTLCSLERDGLITRTVVPTVPVTVRYELTGLGVSLQHVMVGIKDWAQVHMDEVLANREEYDSRAG